jgi:hypothetical protein
MSRQDNIRVVERSYEEQRLAFALASRDQAELTLEALKGPGTAAVAASSAIQAGIAAADAACAHVLGLASAGAHDQATKLLSRISESSKAVNDLGRLLSIKTSVQYGGRAVTEAQAKEAIDRANRLIDFAERIRRR